MDLAALFTGLNATLTAMNEMAKTVIASQPPAVQAEMWNRHMVLTQPLYLLFAKWANALDAKLGIAEPAAKEPAKA